MLEENTYPIKYKCDYNVIMLNEIIKGKQNMTLQEAKLVRLLITQVVKEDKDFKTYVISIKELANYLNVSDSNLYRDIKNICDTLMTRVIRLNTGNPKKPWKIIQWLQLAEYDGNGNIKLMLSNQMEPYILGLNSWFTKYPIKEIFYMSSFYAIRVYEVLNMEKNIMKRHSKEGIYEIVFDITYLRQILECENKFKQVGQFKEKVLGISVKEINKYTDLNIGYECIKTGRKITSIKFVVKENLKLSIDNSNSNNQKNKDNFDKVKLSSVIDLDDLIDELREFITEPIKTKDLKIILKEANNNIALIKSKYEISEQQSKIDNLVAWLIAAIKEDYSEPVPSQGKKDKPSKFINYEQSEWDFNNLEELERQLVDNLSENNMR